MRLYLPKGSCLTACILGVQFVTGQAMLFTLGRADGVAQGWFSAWLNIMGPDGWFRGWLKAKEEYTSTTRRNLGVIS